MFDVSLSSALLAGFLSFLSPCVLPIVPPYFAWIAGISFEELRDESALRSRRYRLLAVAVSFVLGFTTVFVALGATVSVVGKTIAQYFDTLSMIAGLIILVMGLHFVGLIRIGLLYRQLRLNVDKKPAGLLGAYIVGLAFAFGWTPCVGPILAAILLIAGSEGSAMRGAILLSVYSLGIGIPFILAALFLGRFTHLLARFKTHLPKVEKFAGVLLIATGLLFMTGKMSVIANWLIEMFPAFQTLG
ncbi:MAG TPA: cytochrome c biogenesis protein CcdA [Xanthobacteraceae bacterium]|jgi:cytochrome c-type biogenesis protein|nr:cytochrome c biogenesis protein CcdA [Xanthobacteraceae bacterium]